MYKVNTIPFSRAGLARANVTRSAATIAMLAGAAILAIPNAAAGQAQQRSIEEFLAAQGTACDDRFGPFCNLPFAPVPNVVRWAEGPALTPLVLVVDYAGVADAWLIDNSAGAVSVGTTFSGSVTERSLQDGRAEVHVRLHTKNALTWAEGWVLPPPFFWPPIRDPQFGYQAPLVLGGAEPALADSFLDAVFILAAPGDPLPDLRQVLFSEDSTLPEYETIRLSFSATAHGPLREGFGVDEGTPGRLHFTGVEPWHLEDQVPANSAVSDRTAVGIIDIRVVGR